MWRISSTKRSSSVLCVLASGVSKGVGLSPGACVGYSVQVEAVAHAEFVAQRIGARGHQAAVLALPAEAAHLHFVWRLGDFEHRGANNHASDSEVGLALLLGFLFTSRLSMAST